MSTEATKATWKLTKAQVTATQKFILIYLAERANQNGECWPSLKKISDDTGIDRTTIVINRKILIEKGLLVLLDSKKGKTKSVPVMKLNYLNKPLEKPRSIKPKAKKLMSHNSMEIPPAKKKSSSEIHTSKQYGNPYTEPKILEPKKTTTQDTISSFKKRSPSVGRSPVVVISELVDKRIIKAYRKHPFKSPHIQSETDLLKFCKYKIETRDKGQYSEQQRINGIVKLIEGESLHIDPKWINTAHGTDKKIALKQAEYIDYLTRTKADKLLKLLPPNAKVLSFEEWSQQLTN